MKWEKLVKVYDVDPRTGKILAHCPVCGKGTFSILHGIGSCASCSFRGTQETIYRLLTGASREAAEVEVKAVSPKVKIGRLL